MKIQMDKNNPLPLGLQVKEQIKIMIGSGHYKAEDKLPSIKKMAEAFGVNKNTIVTVLKTLEHEGLIESHKGKGIYVKENSMGLEVDNTFITNVDDLIHEAKRRQIDLNELLSIIGTRYTTAPERKRAKVCLFMGLSQQIADYNTQKLREALPMVDLEGVYLSRTLEMEKILQVVNGADVVVTPHIFYDYVRDRVPADKPVIKTMAELKRFKKLKKGIEKKSKIAVIGSTLNSAKALAGVFVSSGYFRPKLVLSTGEIEEYKKELKEIDSFVVCLSARHGLDSMKLKDKDVYFMYDYIDEDSVESVKALCKNLI